MPYYIANLLHLPEEGFYPAFPEEVSFLLLAEPNRSARWALYGCDQLLPEGEGYVRVQEEIEKLLMAAEEYPPAFALARDELKRHPVPEDVTRVEFIADYSKLINSFLDSRESDSFVEVKAIENELGYLTPGEVYWILWYHPVEGSVSWVSDDYHIYRNPASHFDLSESQLKALTPTSVCPPRPQRAIQTPPNPPRIDQ